MVIALRADRLADLAAYPAVSRLVERASTWWAGWARKDSAQAVEAPARQAGLSIEPGLVDLLVREVKDDPGALPLLSHALLETWKRREGNTLTVAGYRASGGIHGAVAQSAERLYAQIDPEHRPLLRDLVLRLVSPGSQGDPVRSRVPRRLIAADAGRDELVERLVAARLVTSDDGVLEITHEALARAWPRLRGWLDDDVEGQRILHHLAAAADAWDALGRPDSELYRGVRLARTLDWQERTSRRSPTRERDFLEAARRVAEAEEQSAAEQARAQSRLIRRLRIVLGGAAVLSSPPSSRAGSPPCSRTGPAQRGRGRSRPPSPRTHGGSEPGPSSPTTSASRCCSRPPVPAGRLAGDPGQPARRAGQAAAPGPVGAAGGGYLEALSVSPDGRWIAASDDQNRMHLYDAATNRLLRSYDAGRPPEDEPAWIFGAFSPDSSQLAVIPERGVHRAGAPAGPGHHAAHGDNSPPRRRTGQRGRCPVQCRRSLSRGHHADVPWSRTTSVTLRATRWSGTSAPRPRHPCGCRPARSRGWRSARTAGPCTPAGR